MICLIVIYSFGVAQLSLAENKTGKSKAKTSAEVEERPVTFVHQISIEGNKVTKERVILKELTFHPFDTIPLNYLAAEAEQSRLNLLNTSLFNFVYINYTVSADNTVHFVIKVEERWYLWVAPIIEQADRNLSSFISNGNWDMMNYGVYLRRDNFRGRQEVVKFRVRVGYSTQVMFGFQSPEFKSKLGWGFLVNYSAFDHASITTVNDQPVYFKSVGHTIQQSLQNQVYVQYRPHLYTYHKLALNYNQQSIADTIRKLNPEYFGGGRSRLSYFELNYSLAYDTRDSKVFPLTGLLSSVGLSKTGFAMKTDDLNYYSISGQLSKYQKIGGRFYSGHKLSGYASTRLQIPHYQNVGIGYNDYVSGYEYYVMDGNSYLLNKNHLLFELVPTKVKQLSFVPFSKFSKIHYAFYLRTFFDLGYVNNPNASKSNLMVNTVNYGYGAGIDFVTFYDKALCLYYAFNKLGEHGLFVNFYLKM